MVQPLEKRLVTERRIAFGTTAPTHTATGPEVWFDETTDPPVLKGWNGSAYVAIGGATLAQTLLTTEDLDTVTTPGFYLQNLSANATLARHYPVTLAGHLEVYAGGDPIFRLHRYTEFDTPSPVTWVRTFYNGAWATWEQLLDTSFADAKGDLVVATAADAMTRLPVGTNNQVLTADSAQASGVKWAAVAGGMAYSTPPLNNWWASPVLITPTNKPMSTLLNMPLWLPPMGTTTQGFIDINTTTAGNAADTCTVTLYGATTTYEVDTGTVLGTFVFPLDGVVGRKELAITGGLVIPSGGLFAQITAFTAASPARLTSGSPGGIAPRRSYGSGSGDAIGLTPIDLPNIFFKRTA